MESGRRLGLAWRLELGEIGLGPVPVAHDWRGDGGALDGGEAAKTPKRIGQEAGLKSAGLKAMEHESRRAEKTHGA